MNILIVNPGKEYGGAEIYTRLLAVGLRKKGHNVYLALNQKGEMRKRVVNSADVLILECNYKSIANDCFKLKDFVENKKIQVIQCNGKNAMLLALIIRKCKKIAVLHGDILVDYYSKGFIRYAHLLLEFLLIKLYKVVVAVSEPLKDLLSSRYHKDMFFVNNAVDYMKYPTYANVDSRCLRVCSMGRLTEIKNYPVLIKAFYYLKSRGVTNISCDIYGNGEDKDKLQQMIDIYKLDNVKLCGFKDTVRNYLNDYHIYIQPSTYESFGLAVIEAYNAGCFVIANKVGGLEYIVNKIGHGYLIDECTAQNIANCLQKLNNDRTIMVKEKINHDKLEEFFSEYFINKMENIYREAL